MRIGPDFWRLVGLAVAIIAASTAVSAWRQHRTSPGAIHQRKARAIARARQRLAAADERFGGPHHA